MCGWCCDRLLLRCLFHPLCGDFGFVWLQGLGTRLCVERNARFLFFQFPWLLRGSLALFKKPMVPIPHSSKRMFYTTCRRLQLTWTFLGQGFGWPSLDPFILHRAANFCFCPCFTVCSSLWSWPISLLFIEALAPAPFVCGPYRRRAS